jgi:hypothetical protein
MDPRLISTLISSIVGIFVPLTIWYLNKNEKNQEIEDIERQIKRLNLIERISTVSEEANIDTKQLIRDELDKAIKVLYPEDDDKQYENNNLSYDELPLWRKVFLIFKPKNTKVLLLQLVYFYLIFSVITLFGEIVFSDAIEQLSQELKEDEVPKTIVSLFFILVLFLQLGITKVTHFFATKLQKKD